MSTQRGERGQSLTTEARVLGMVVVAGLAVALKAAWLRKVPLIKR